MKTIICFDVDGIFQQREEQSQYVTGPINPDYVNDNFNDKKDSICFVVSPSPYYPKGKNGEPMFSTFAQWQSNTMRWKNLVDAVDSLTVRPDVRIYVSDNGDMKEAQKAGFIYCDVMDFQKMMDEKLTTFKDFPKEEEDAD